jgi:hypothetical protein
VAKGDKIFWLNEKKPYVKRFLIDVIELAIGDLETDQIGGQSEGLSGQSQERVAVEFELAQFGEELEGLGRDGRQDVVAEIQFDQIG